MNQDEIIKYLHKNIHGAQDNGLKHELTKEKPIYDYIICRKTVELFSENGIHIINSINEDPTLINKGIANIKIEGDWTYGQMEINYPNIADYPYKIINQFYKKSEINKIAHIEDGLCIPILEKFQIKFNIKINTSCKLSYNIVYINAPIYYNIPIKEYQIQSDELYKSNELYKFNLCFHHPTEKLTIFADKPIEYANFYCYKYILNFNKITDTQYELDFGKNTINLTRITDLFIMIKSIEPDNKITIRGDSYNILNYSSALSEIKIKYTA